MSNACLLSHVYVWKNLLCISPFIPNQTVTANIKLHSELAGGIYIEGAATYLQMACATQLWQMISIDKMFHRGTTRACLLHGQTWPSVITRLMAFFTNESRAYSFGVFFHGGGQMGGKCLLVPPASPPPRGPPLRTRSRFLRDLTRSLVNVKSGLGPT